MNAKEEPPAVPAGTKDDASQNPGSKPSVEEKVRGTERLRLLLDVSATLAAHRDLHTLLREISTALQRLVKHDYSSLSLYDPELSVCNKIKITFIDTWPNALSSLEIRCSSSLDEKRACGD